MPSTPRQIYVASDGNDVSGQGTSRRPFATIQRAVLLRRNRAWAMTADQYVNVAAGVYYDTAVELTDADSGLSGFDVVYRCTGDPGEAELVGGALANPDGWEDMTGGVWRMPLASPAYTLYDDGVRSRMARIPAWNPGVDFPCALGPYFLTTGDSDGSKTVMTYDDDDLDYGSWQSPLASDSFVMWSSLFAPQTDWFMDTLGATTFDAGVSFTLNHDGVKFFTFNNTAAARYFAQGDLSMLDGTLAGEVRTFVNDGGYLYYKTFDGNAPVDILIPTTKTIVSAVGADSDNRVSHVRFEGFAAWGGAFDSWYQYGDDGNQVDPYGYFDTRPEFRCGGFYLENADNITVDSTHVHNVGYAGVFLQGAVSNCTVSNTWIEHTGADGISVNGLPPGGGDLSTGNTFSNYKVNNYGELDGSSTGHRISQSSDNTCINWEISDGPRRAVWIQGSFDDDAEDNYAHGNVVILGTVADVCQDSGDAGALGMSFLESPTPPSVNPPNTFSQIIVDGVEAFDGTPGPMLDSKPVGLYFDNHASGQIVTCVELLNITPGTRPPFFYNDCSGAILTNNTFLDNGDPNPSFDPDLMSPDIGLTDAWPW